MDYQKLREEMTEPALSIENALRANPKVSLAGLCEACNITKTEAEFILHQMEAFHITRRTLNGAFSLTPEYLTARL